MQVRFALKFSRLPECHILTDMLGGRAVDYNYFAIFKCEEFVDGNGPFSS